MNDPEQIAARLVGGERAALARLISWAENTDPRFPAALALCYPRVGRAWRIGLTGPPGAGKSSLASALIEELRKAGRTVGVLAIDPSSPFTGGALLGDRIRMEERTTDPGVYIRSMATRASHGGLSRAAADACDVMDAFGFDALLIETVGVGQTEYEIARAADTVVVILCPGAGDAIQAMKAGLLEVADVLVANKSDLAGPGPALLRPRRPAPGRGLEGPGRGDQRPELGRGRSAAHGHRRAPPIPGGGRTGPAPAREARGPGPARGPGAARGGALGAGRARGTRSRAPGEVPDTLRCS
jgi:LAO/AO transport system kinase